LPVLLIKPSRTFVEVLFNIHNSGPRRAVFFSASLQRRIELISPSIESLLTSKVLQRLPFIPNALRLKSGSSSRKEEDPVAEKIDRPVLVMTVSIQSKNNISTRSAIWRV